MFFLKKKEIELNFYTTDSSVYNYAPIKKAGQFIPDWWKKLPKPGILDESTLITSTNMKYCSGFTELYSKGFIVPLWSDLNVEIGKIGFPEYRYQFSDRRSVIESHNESQHNGIFPSNEFQQLKILSPWVAECEEDIKFLVIQPTWNFTEFLPIIVPGIVEFKYQIGVHINLFLKREEQNKVFSFKFGQPMFHLIPLTEKKINGL